MYIYIICNITYILLYSKYLVPIKPATAKV